MAERQVRPYRRLGPWVGLAILLACFLSAQVAKKRTVSKGPRAVALLQIADNGRARLIPVTIMINGDFYDASAYKADPVPMALQPDTVYEGVTAGVPQGLFTVGGAAQTNGNWFADGKWQTQAQLDADKAKAAADVAKKNQTAPADEELGGPPKLRHSPESSSSGSTTSSSSPASSSAPAPSTPTAAPPKKEEQKTKPQSSDTAPPSIDAPDRPILRREPVSETSHEQTKSTPDTSPLNGPIQFVVAVSDAAGPQPRPYTFKMKPEEEQAFQKKMVAMAADEVKQRAGHLAREGLTPKTSAPKNSARVKRQPPSPEFRDVQMRVYDVSTTNEAVLVLTASATMPGDDKQYLTAVVARQDIYGELHKIFGETTDNKHLDVLPKYDFIDVVDADGDGRAELLFRESWDSGSAFSVYRVLGDRLWPLFEGKPGS